MTTPQSKGGQVMAVRQKKEAEARYNLAPRHCLSCQRPILLNGRKAGDARRTKFCNQSCAARYNNASRVRKTKPCRVCGGPVYYLHGHYNRWCSSCRAGHAEKLVSMTKKQAGPRRISQHARLVLKKLGRTSCEICRYSKTFEAAHVRPVASFTASTPLSVINSPRNLRPLCPNHHWEFDHNLL